MCLSQCCSDHLCRRRPPAACIYTAEGPEATLQLNQTVPLLIGSESVKPTPVSKVALPFYWSILLDSVSLEKLGCFSITGSYDRSCVCLSVVSVHLYVPLHAHVEARGQSMLAVFLNHSSPYFCYRISCWACSSLCQVECPTSQYPRVSSPVWDYRLTWSHNLLCGC